MQTNYCVSRFYWRWLGEKVLKLCWFEGPELPPSLLRVKKKRKKKETDQVHRYKANTEETERNQRKETKEK